MVMINYVVECKTDRQEDASYIRFTVKDGIWEINFPNSTSNYII